MKTKILGVKVDQSMLRRLDTRAAELRKAQPGAIFTRSSVVRMAIETALAGTGK